MEKKMKRLYRWITGLHIFIGTGAMAGGIAAVSDPESPMGMPVEMLKSSPFESYMIPGLFLLIALGLGNISISFLTIKRIRFHGLLSMAMGGILALWILIQCYFLQTVGGLHIIFFILGIIQWILGTTIMYKRNDFPLDIIKIHLKKLRE
jgi:hypothetical protein